jgi:hypothetical protein
MLTFVRLLRVVLLPLSKRSSSRRRRPFLMSLVDLRGSLLAPQPGTGAATTSTALLRPLAEPLELFVRLRARLPPRTPLLVLLLGVVLFPVFRLPRSMTNLTTTSRLRPRTFPKSSITLGSQLLKPQPRVAATAAREAATALTALLRPLALEL